MLLCSPVAVPEKVGGGGCGGSRAVEGGGRGLSSRGMCPSQNVCSILDLKMASFGALWVPAGVHPPYPSWIRRCYTL